jgi:Zn-dependent alcohol dehydrogenase
MYKPLVLARILDFLVRNANKRPFERLISHHFELDKINEAFAQSEWQQTEETPVIRAALVP